MDDHAEHALVVRAFTCGVRNCVEWCDERTTFRLRRDPDLQGLTPEAIKRIVFDFVLAGGTIGQVREGRERYRQDFPYYYKAIIPLEGFPRGLFVEMRLVDGDDPEYPIVHLVNAHPQQGAR